MASEKGVLASGLESDSQSTRRRNVPSTAPNGGMVNRVEIDDKKTQTKKVRGDRLPHKLAIISSTKRRLSNALQQKEQTLLEFLDEWEFLIAPLIFTIFAFFTRMYKIGLSPIVTWDEAQYEAPILYPSQLSN
jgi:dolichyl-phosphate-mannose-protein mannosyltransferase